MANGIPCQQMPTHQISFEVGILSHSSKFQRKYYDIQYVNKSVIPVMSVKLKVLSYGYAIISYLKLWYRFEYFITKPYLLLMTNGIVIVVHNL